MALSMAVLEHNYRNTGIKRRVRGEAVARLEGLGDGDGAAVLEVILAEEIGHVAAGFGAAGDARLRVPVTGWP